MCYCMAMIPAWNTSRYWLFMTLKIKSDTRLAVSILKHVPSAPKVRKNTDCNQTTQNVRQCSGYTPPFKQQTYTMINER